jgi:tRNA G46 methylase TrmB
LVREVFRSTRASAIGWFPNLKEKTSPSQGNLQADGVPCGVVAKLERGAKVADIGCGHGWSTVLMAKAFPKSQFVGYDFHAGSIDDARAHAREHGVGSTRGSRSRPSSRFPTKASTS